MSDAGLLRPWARAVLAGSPPAPVVLVLGGFLTSPPIYRGFAGRLRARGAADVVVANVWTMDWLLAACRGFGPIATRAGRALLEASRRSDAVSGGAPLLVIGHSAGGIVARLLTSPVPFEGRLLNASGRIGAIVTLGTPHRVAADAGIRNRAGADTAAFANRAVPGGTFAPTTGYLAIASRRVAGRDQGSPGERRTWAVYRSIAPEPAGPVIEGDGLVPLVSALLPGVPQLVLDDAAHGGRLGRDWYGSDRFLDRWWPLALETWEAALRARVAAPAPGSPAPGPVPVL
jgi:hypothetical protein